MRYDLHVHSTVSDGTYSPADLVDRAVAAGIDVLALTDHDTTDGLEEAAMASRLLGIRLISGVEISTTWNNKTLHVVGLNIQPECELLQAGLAQLKGVRLDRAEQIGQKLEKAGIKGVYEDVLRVSGSGMITRTHFAQAIVRRRLALDVRDVFNRYLVSGKPGYVGTEWVSTDAAIAWIQAAGGIAVLAHPQRYKLTGSWLRRLLGEFRDMGGRGLEVLSGTASVGDVQSSAGLARNFDLLASCGSDFHGPDGAWPKLGRLPAMPDGVTPVWHAWENAGSWVGVKRPPASHDE